MTIAMRVFGGLLVLMGTIWFLQGADILTAGNSPMIGDPQWEVYGGLAAGVGIALLVFSWTRTRPRTNR